ncbi:hypothetical protein [Campylobacter sp. US33a]|uniref:Uncharacterized protein n=1 Tax=Campylobacter sp. CCS1377 TaxID=3158229 RepID=A0AAU7E6E0_9BACT|nr:hypothetical protein [Campylobacter sp. US33a]MCW1359890.1 hypothetical protein [Campylobacter jejuni]
MKKDLIKAKELSSKLCEKNTKLCFAQGWVELFNKNDMLNKLANLSSGKPMFIDIEFN